MAYRMLGSRTEADDAVQEAWLRLSRADPGAVRDLGRWLTTVVGRLCLDMLRSRAAHREEPLDEHVPEPATSRAGEVDPEQEALMAESVGLALLVVLDTLAPAERLALVLHDMFAVPFEQIASILGRSPNAAKQLASRARQRVQAANTMPDTDTARQTRLVRAFLAASRNGNFAALLEALDPDVVLRADPTAVKAGPGRGSRRTCRCEAIRRTRRNHAARTHCRNAQHRLGHHSRNTTCRIPLHDQARADHSNRHDL